MVAAKNFNADKATSASGEGAATHSGDHVQKSGLARVFTLAAGRPFLKSFAQAVLAGDLPQIGGAKPSGFDLPAMTILLPTRRAARSLQEAFLEVARQGSGNTALLLPKIQPIAEGLEDLNLLAGLAGLDAVGGIDLEIPPAVAEIERRLVLSQLVMAWSAAQRRADSDVSDGDGDLGVVAGGGAATPAQAAIQASELASLIDTFQTENVSLDGLKDLVPENFSSHWQRTLDFLEIVTAFWPAHLKERGLVSGADRRNRLILSDAARMQATTPIGPVIVAGVTGSIPATVALMKVVAELEQGAIVLPGLDQMMDDASWSEISGGEADHPEHPQFGLKKLLDSLGVQRSQVQMLPERDADTDADAGAERHFRQVLISEAMRPAGGHPHWHVFTETADKKGIRDALQGISLLEAPNAQDEAETIALILREVAETPDKTAALISPDRLLARRVAIRLETWGVRVDDSAGRPFAKTVPGAFLDLVISAAAEQFSPPALMALLKHPLARLGRRAIDIRRAARALELAAFRQPYLGGGLNGVDAALERARNNTGGETRQSRAVKRLWDDDWNAARELVAALKTAFEPLVKLFASRDQFGLNELATAHVTVAEALSMLPDEKEPTALWRGEAGESAALFFAGLIDDDMPAPELASRDYPDFYRALIVGQNVLPKVPVHPRLSIWGQFEGRLQQPDVVILGSLNEGTWPKAADPGPWLNRPMRLALGLPSPEEAIGSSAHDFTSFLGADRVYLTRAAKVDGVPTVPSRWLMRIEALLDGLDLGDALAPERPWLSWTRYRDVIPQRIVIAAPEPRPPVALRPRQLSVTAIEKWIANPYAIFAGRILKLDPLPPLAYEPDAALKGAVIHDALSRFTKRHSEALPDDIQGELMALVREVLDDYKAHPRVAAFWLRRLNRFAGWFAGREPEWREGFANRLAEVSGAQLIDAPAGQFKLTARADRIDYGTSGLIITDYKTGQAPSDKKVLSGASPQLPLEAAIALGLNEGDGFAGLPVTAVSGLRYICASGGEPPGVVRMVSTKELSVPQMAERALQGLRELVAEFDKVETPYKALRRANFDYRYDDYSHLARVAEWSGQSEEEA